MASTLSIGLSGLKAAQIGMDVTSHNISNVNTPNFRRQLVDLTEVSFPSNSPSIPSGAGVAVANIHNAGSPLVLKGYTDALSNSAEYNTLAGLSKPFDALLNNPALNLSTAMQDTFNAFEDVATNPTDIATRQNAIDKSQIFVDKSSSLMGELGSLKNNLQTNLKGDMEKANSLLSNIADLNKQIAATGNNQNSSLASQRDSMTLDLAKLTGISVSDDKSTIISTSGKLLLQNGVSVSPLTASDLPSIQGGSIGGTNKFITTMLDVAMSNLPGVVNQVASEINTQATQGYDLNGKPGSPIFNIFSGTLSNFSLAINDPRNFGAASTPTGTNDGTNAQKMFDLKNKKVNGETFQETYSSLISGFDNRTKNYSDMKNAYDSITDDFANSLQDDAGVNLDEEAANLLKYKQMYSANAQVIKTQNEMFGTLIDIVA